MQPVTRISRILLWLFIINLGIAFGAGIYEHRIVFSNWLASSPDAQLHWNAAAAEHDNTGLRFWVFVTTIPLTVLTLANLIAAWRAAGELRRWWLIASGAALADRAFTFAYFIPVMIGLLQAPDSPEAVSTAVQWGNLNYLRHAFVFVAWITALKAFAVMHDSERF